MKQIVLKLLRPAMWIMLIVVLMMACQNGNDVTPSGSTSGIAAANKSQIIATTQDVLGITSDALSGESISGGRSATINAGPHWGHHDGCRPEITHTLPKIVSTKDSLSYSGSVTIDYGHGGNCGGDSTNMHVHKGKIMDSFTLTAVLVNDSTVIETSIETITFSGCSRDSIQIDGTIVSKVSGNTTTVEIQNVKLTYTDGSSITWSGTLTYTYDNGGTRMDFSDDTKSITGSLSGSSSDGVSYSNNITKPVLYKFTCVENKISAPVSGTIEVNAGSTTSVIDYGDGTCDNTYTITTGGTTLSNTF